MGSLAERQQALVDKFLFIPDPQERLAAVISHRARLRPLTPESRIEAHLVRGCSSRVWVVGNLEEGKCFFSTDAESPLVRGLVGLLCELYDGAGPAEIAGFKPQLFEGLELAANLSPTRLNGLASVRRVIREFALQHVDRRP